jgi:hypothetical protein
MMSFGIVVGEDRIEETRHRHVDAVEPEDRLIAVIRMIVPETGRRDDEIALLHSRAFAVDRRVGAALAFEHEADRGGRMPVRGRDLARHDHLHPARQRADRRLDAAEARIDEQQHAALRLRRRNDAAGFHHGRANGVEAPEMRERARARLLHHVHFGAAPERRQMLLADLLVEKILRARPVFRHRHAHLPLCPESLYRAKAGVAGRRRSPAGKL